MTSDQIDDDALANEVVHWMVITAVHDRALWNVKGKNAGVLDKNDDFKELLRLGCDKDKLLNTLAFANEMPRLYPPISANALRTLARDVTDVLDRMHRITPSKALLWVEERPDGKQVLIPRPTGGDFHVWPELDRELRWKAGAYRKLARLCRLRKIPSRAAFRKLAFVWPLLYVKSCTGSPHYAEVSTLLCLTGTTKSKKQLKAAFLSAEKEHPSVLSWMELAADVIQQTNLFI